MFCFKWLMFKSSSEEILREVICRTKPQKDGEEESGWTFSQTIKLRKDFVLNDNIQRKVNEHILKILLDSCDEWTRQMFTQSRGDVKKSINL